MKDLDVRGIQQKRIKFLVNEYFLLTMLLTKIASIDLNVLAIILL